MSTVRITGLVKKFGGVTAVDDISITAEEGQLTTLLGPSGCGKTTTLRMVAGLENPDAGEISIGSDLVSAPAKNINIASENRNIGMVFQSYAIWPHKSAFENVAYPLKLRRMTKKEINDRVKEIFSLLRLEGLEERYPGQLSGGQQQRIALGRAIAYKSRLLLLDEPLANLDAKVREQVRFELKELQRQLKFTTIYVTHDQAEAMAISDKIIVIDHGVVVQEGSAFDIYHNPNTRFVANFVGQSNFLEGKLISIEGSKGLIDVGDDIVIDGRLQKTGNIDQHITLCLRPEDFEISEVQPPMADRKIWFEGIIRAFTFQGNIVTYLVDSPHQSFQIQAESSLENQFKEGNRVYLKVRENRARMVI